MMSVEVSNKTKQNSGHHMAQVELLSITRGFAPAFFLPLGSLNLRHGYWTELYVPQLFWVEDG